MTLMTTPSTPAKVFGTGNQHKQDIETMEKKHYLQPLCEVCEADATEAIMVTSVDVLDDPAGSGEYGLAPEGNAFADDLWTESID